MIRLAENDDIVDVAGLWARAFPGERTVEQRIRHLETGGVFGGLETTFVDRRESRLVGAFRAYTLTQHLHGAAYPMLALAAVAVDETARRRGIGRELCLHALRIGVERGDVLSALYPFRPAFYHALGWGLVGELHAYRFRPEWLVHTRSGDVRRATDGDTNAIAACYARVATASNGLITRTPRVWRQHLEGDGTHIYHAGEDRVRGYLIARFGRGASAEDRPLVISELIAEDRQTYETLLGWIAAQRDTWRVAQYDATPDELFAHRLVEPRPPGYRTARYLWSTVASVLRGPMVRVLDVPRALTMRRRWGPAAPLRFSLRVNDEQLPWNAGPFTVDFDGRSANVSKADGTRPSLAIDAPALAQVFAGELTLHDALHLGVAECDGDASAIDTLFRVDRCFRLLDEF